MTRRFPQWLRPWTLVKIGLSVGIVVGLLYYTRYKNPQTFDDLWTQPKKWGYLALATVACSAATLLTFVRWYYLVRALEMPFHFRDAMRISFLGYLFNMAPTGIVGGDLLKAIMVARQQHGRRAQAVATVVVDRIIGLYVLFVVAAVAVLAIGLQRAAEIETRWVANITLLIAATSSLGLAMLFIPGITNGRLTRSLGRLPKIGHILASLIDAVRMYRRKVHVLANACLMSVVVHSLFTVGVYFIACGLFEQVLPVSTHFVVMPLSAAMGAIPLSMGPFEIMLQFLYPRMPAPPGVVATGAQGLIVALAYRIITLVFAAVGVCYYLAARREVAEVIEEAEHESATDDPPETASATEIASVPLGNSPRAV